MRVALLDALVALLAGCASLPACDEAGVSLATKASRDVRLDRFGRYIYCPRDSAGRCVEGGMSCVVR